MNIQMEKKKTAVLLFISFAMLIYFRSATSGSDEKLDVSHATVKIIQTYIMPDYSTPWKMKEPNTLVGSGAIITGGMILTNAHIVSNSTYIQVQKENDPDLYDAEILHIAHDCDLALLGIKDKRFYQNTVQLDLGDIPQLRSKVTTYGYPMGGTRISITEGVVSRIEISEYTHSSNLAYLTIQTDAAINPGNSGGPVIQNNKLVGVAFQTTQDSENIGYLIPVPIIQHFLKDIKDGKYDGFPGLGLYTNNLMNVSYRNYLGMAEGQSGIVVKLVIPGGGAEKHIKPDDVIMSIDNTPIANDGSIKFRQGRIFYSYLIDNKQVGDAVTLKLFRRGKVITVNYPLKNYAFRISLVNEYDVLPRYFIYGGLVFQNLSREYLKTWDKWWYNADRRMLYYYSYHISDNIHPDRKEFVVINRVLPDYANTYISELQDKIVREINGQKIRSLNDALNAFGKPSGKFHIIYFDGYNIPVILKASEMEEANMRIMRKYGIPVMKNLN